MLVIAKAKKRKLDSVNTMEKIPHIFQNLIGVTCNNIHWPSALEMVNWKVQIEVLYTPLWYLSMQKMIKFYVAPHATLPNKVHV